MLSDHRCSKGPFRRLRHIYAEGLRAPTCEIVIIGVRGQCIPVQPFSQALSEVLLQPGCIHVKQQQQHSLETPLRSQLGLGSLGSGALPLCLALLLLLLAVLALAMHRCGRHRQLRLW